MNPLLLLCFLVSFLVTFFLIPPWIATAHRINLVGKDMNKYDKPKIAEMGGLIVNAGFLSGTLLYVGITTFIFGKSSHLLYILATISTCLIIMIIGIIDDILGWKLGLKQWQKPLLTLPAALPMAAVNAGVSEMILPFFGSVDFGIFYPLLLVPMGIVGAANGFNMLAGYNGLEAGMGVIILSTLGFIAWKTEQGYVAMLAFCMVFALLAFLFYNWYPAKIFPGDTLTYSVGALIACVAIIGNMERVALFLFIPYFIEFVLKARSRFKAESFGIPDENNCLKVEKIYGLEHLALKFFKKEKSVVIFLLSLEMILSLTYIGLCCL